ncbi:hypothetical protein HMPREF0766_10314 [Sphingobacterium spiritivorum ATCC 33861]|uniref:Uncharacterized protein n=1 Tax=Sphingobacterium spiritivorum ATCC 33861 TaxID=525373 RepID=D7VH45_SPHSI|nr:hypothetical protein HMPREF0766_10314 [Sphingobacterium spiritivorum ATCC 33861]
MPGVQVYFIVKNPYMRIGNARNADNWILSLYRVAYQQRKTY